MARSRSIGALLVMVLFFGAVAGFGGVMVFIIAEGAYYGFDSRSWPATEGIIDESRIMTQEGENDKKKHHLVIHYRYRVDGTSYRNDKAQFLDNVFYPRTSKQEVAAKFKPGQKVRVYHHPSNPRVAVLMPGFPIITFIGGLLVGMLFLGIGVLGLLLLRK